MNAIDQSTDTTLSERVLLRLSRKPGTDDFAGSQQEWNLENALSQLLPAFPNLVRLVEGKDVLDFGCGEGWQTVAMAKSGARFVLGLDSSAKMISKARQVARNAGVGDRVEFSQDIDECSQRFDIVISQNSMEHFPEPMDALQQMKQVLRPDGRILLTFAPPWFAPYGSHMHFFTKVPWVNLLFSERTIMNVRKNFRQDGAERYEDVEFGLNKMTVSRFERLLSSAGLRVEFRRYRCSKKMNALAILPLLRELFVNQIDCILSLEASEQTAISARSAA